MRIYLCTTLFSKGLWLKSIVKKMLLDAKGQHFWGGSRRAHVPNDRAWEKDTLQTAGNCKENNLNIVIFSGLN